MRREKDKLPEAASFELAADFTDEVLDAVNQLHNLLAPTVSLAHQIKAAMRMDVVLICPRTFGNLTNFYGYDVIVADVDFPYVGVRSRA